MHIHNFHDILAAIENLLCARKKELDLSDDETHASPELIEAQAETSAQVDTLASHLGVAAQDAGIDLSVHPVIAETVASATPASEPSPDPAPADSTETTEPASETPAT